MVHGKTYSQTRKGLLVLMHLTQAWAQARGLSAARHLVETQPECEPSQAA